MSSSELYDIFIGDLFFHCRGYFITAFANIVLKRLFYFGSAIFSMELIDFEGGRFYCFLNGSDLFYFLFFEGL